MSTIIQSLILFTLLAGEEPVMQLLHLAFGAVFIGFMLWFAWHIYVVAPYRFICWVWGAIK